MIEARSSNQGPASFIIWRAAVLLALAASAALYMQYLDPGGAAFCGLGSGCETVRRAGFSYFGSRYVSVPLLGLLGYAAVFATSVLVPETPLARLLTIVGGVFGAGLLGAQIFYIHAFCWLCTVVDISAIVAAIAAFLHGPAGGETADPLRGWAWTALAGIAVSAPLVWVAVKPSPPVPAAITALYVPGKINVVEFGDFECPFCRAFHPVLQGVLHDYPPDTVHFVRKHVPLEAHEAARPAARADVCAEAQSKGEALADRLVQIDLSPSANRRAALEIGVDATRFDSCMGSSEPDVRIDDDTKLLKSVGMEGLPTTYIGGKRLLGAVSEEAVRDAVEKAKTGAGNGGISGWVYGAAVLALLGAAVWLGRASRGTL